MRDRITLNESYAARKGSVSVSVEAQPIHHNFDERELGAGPAAALRDAIVEGIRGITERVSKATLARRRKANPGASDRLFNDSGRLAQGLDVRLRGDTWEVTAPPDRLNASSVTDSGALERMLQRLFELVPALRDPLTIKSVRDAIERSVSKLISVGRR